MGQQVKFDTLRSLAFGSITASYVPLGTALTVAARLMCITNNTDGDILFSTDGINDMLFVAHGTFKLFDLDTNKEEIDRKFVLPIGTQFLVKYSSAPTTGAVYLEILYG